MLRSNRQARSRRPLTQFVLATVVACMMALVLLAPESALANERAFQKRHAENLTGRFDIVANTLITCDPVGSCPAALDGSAGQVNHSLISAVFVDTDGDTSTFNSSSADLALPAGARVTYARLYWMGTFATNSGYPGFRTPMPNPSDKNKARFRVPGQGYQTIMADLIDQINGVPQSPHYLAGATVTSMVQAAGAGSYTVANVQSSLNGLASWAMVVVYEVPGDPSRNITLFDGLKVVTNTAQIAVSGFTTPPSGTVRTRIGIVNIDGDKGFPDNLRLNSTQLSNAVNPVTDFHNSTISRDGQNVTTRNPAFVNNLIIDADVLQADNILANGATSATLSFNSSGDTILPLVAVFQTDLFAPTLSVQKSAADLTGDATTRPYDQIEYTIVVTNTGGDTANNVVLTDPIPAYMAYVPGSLMIDGVAKTDQSDDQASFDAARHQAVFYLGSGATSSTGGSLAVGASTTVKLRAIAQGGQNGVTYTNTATVSAVGATTGGTVSASGSAPITVTNANDVRVTNTVSNPNPSPGDTVTYTITVTNNGPSSTGPLLNDNFDSLVGVTWTCAGTAGGVCGSANGTGNISLFLLLPAGGSATFTATGTVRSGLTAGAYPNVATASPAAGSVFLTPSAATATASFTIAEVARVGLAKRVAQIVDNGDGSFTARFLIKVRNYGNVALTNVDVFDDLAATFGSAASFAVVPGSVNQGISTSNVPNPAFDGRADTLVATFPTLGTAGSGEFVSFAVRVRPGGSTGPFGNTARVVARTPSGATASDLSMAGGEPDPNGDSNPTEALPTLVSFTPNADLAVELTAPTGLVYAGDSTTYILKVTNNGPSQATGVNLGQTFDQPVQVVSMTPTSGSCSGTTDVTCGLGAISSGDSVTVTVVVRPAGAGGLISQATVTSPVPDPHPDNNTVSRGIVVLPSADLALTKSVAPTNPLVGQTVTATLTVTNNGPSPATRVSLTDQLLGSATFVSATTSPAGLPCGPTGVSITCDLATLAPSASVVVTVTYTVDGTGVLTDLGSVTAAEHDPVANNNGASGKVNATDSADLAVAKTAPATATVGQTITYAITVSNAGPSPARSVTATDQLPPGVTLVSATSSQGSCSISGTDRATCQLGTIAAAGSATMTIQGTVTGSGTLTNSVVALSASSDPNLANNQATAVTTATGTADLAATLAASSATVAQNGTVTFTGSVTNNGPNQASGVTLRFVATNADALTASSPQGPCNVSGAVVECVVANIPPGATAQVTVTALAPTVGQLGGILSGTASEPDPNPANNVQTAVVTVGTPVGPPVNLQVTKTQPAAVTSGQAVPIQITVNPNGGTAPGATVTHVLPPGLTLTGTPTSSQGTCSTPQVGVVICDLGTVTAPVTISVPTTATGSGVQTTTTSVTTSAPVTTPAATTTTATTTVTANADLSITVVPSAAPVNANSPLTFAVTVSNAGPNAATDVVVSNLLSGVAFDLASFTPSQGSCSTGVAASCSLGAISAGDSATITVTGTPRAVGGLVDTATVSSSSTDPNASNNAASAGVQVTAVADLQVTLTVTPDPVGTGAGLTYVATIRNQGPTAVADAVALGALDRVASLVSVTTSQGLCRPLAGLLVCELGPIAPNGVVTVTVVVTEDAVGVLVGGVSVVAAEPDPNADNNLAFAAVRVIATATTSTLPVATPPATEYRNDPNNDDENDKPKETEEERRQREQTNRGGLDDDRTEGNVVAVRCTDGAVTDSVGWMDDGQDAPYAVIVNRDGLQKVRLIGEAKTTCRSIKVGQYLEADGVKQTEQLFDAENVKVR